jgi:3-oxoacid CoA-transferase subunit B
MVQGNPCPICPGECREAIFIIGGEDMSLTRQQIAIRAEQEIEDGFYVNLGIGMPTLVANYISENKQVVLQSENGLLGIGPYPTEEEVDPDLINAGKETVTTVKGASYAMDLVHGAKRIVIIMDHVNKKGEPKILNSCTLPLTGKRVVNRIITDRAVIDVTEKGLVLVEIAEGYSAEDIQASTEPHLIISDDLKLIRT